MGQTLQESYLAAIAGGGIVASADFMPTATPYAGGDLIDVAKEFKFTDRNLLAIPNGSLIRILTAIIKIADSAVPSGQTSFDLQMYSVTPASAQADNAVWTLDVGDLPTYRGSIGLGTPVDKGGALFVKTGGLFEDVKLIGNSLFGQLVTAGGHTPAATARQVLLYGIVL